MFKWLFWVAYHTNVSCAWDIVLISMKLISSYPTQFCRALGKEQFLILVIPNQKGGSKLEALIQRTVHRYWRKIEVRIHYILQVDSNTTKTRTGLARIWSPWGCVIDFTAFYRKTKNSFYWNIIFLFTIIPISSKNNPSKNNLWNHFSLIKLGLIISISAGRIIILSIISDMIYQLKLWWYLRGLIVSIRVHLIFNSGNKKSLIRFCHCCFLWFCD